jgi:glycosyltransferase involved in cell wall biosynthesis
VPYKKVDLIVRSFATMPDKQLIVIGDGPDFEKIKAIATPNVTLLGYQPFEVLLSHLRQAKAFIFAAEEDFGIAPLEAQACGTPVIAYGKGGALETILGKKSDLAQSGLFFPEQTSDAIIDAVSRFESLSTPILAANCRQNALRFSKERFRTQLTELIEAALLKHLAQQR